ncbi:hypothetical protein B488_01340 [Liberibacter crescens BT-1]|uniref:Inositolphosphotransferase Aur1/Ipt1 domain-containing protein n=1 Tax=Liberibacter crescens (strain BT-1) TaxID=1215343 RepID=L0ET54_LIBCB|nr:phosphatase PAP2 family protein [Liberibacter crescens]AGA64127.1 hypothetical protein B488_01340 [Liberibacter crescens BT-1]
MSSDSRPLQVSRFLLISLFIFSFSVTLAISPYVNLIIDYKSLLQFLVIVITIICISNVLQVFFDFFLLRSIVEVIGWGLCLTPIIIISTYIAMHFHQPLVDNTLSLVDERLGFHWISFIRFVDARPWLSFWLKESYSSFAFQLLIWPIILIFLKIPERAYIMVTSYGVLCFVSSIVATWFPALGTYVYYHIDPDTLKNIDSFYVYHFLQQFDAVRDQSPFHLLFRDTAGIITFPSVHAAVATLCIWAAWPLKFLKWVSLLLNFLMMVSAVANASHYLIDIIAGAVVAIMSISFLVALIGRITKSDTFIFYKFQPLKEKSEIL